MLYSNKSFLQSYINLQFPFCVFMNVIVLLCVARHLKIYPLALFENEQYRNWWLWWFAESEPNLTFFGDHTVKTQM